MRAGKLALLWAVTSAAALAAGCAAIPDSTPVVVVDENLGAQEGPVVPTAPPGLEPLALVRDFVEASISHDDAHQVARSYLTREAAERWNDAAPITVIDDIFHTPPLKAGPQDSDRRQVTLRTTEIGQLDQSGVFTLRPGEGDRTLTVLRQDGEWRISDPPPGLIMPISDFRATFRIVNLSFVDPAKNVLVRDRRWVLNRPPSALPGRVIDLLLGEPSPDLRGSVVNELSGARLHTNVANGPDGTLVVDLTAVRPLTPTERELAAAQIVHSLGEVANQPVRILVDNARLIQDRDTWKQEDVGRYVQSVNVPPGLPGLVVTGGQVLPIGGSRPAGPIEGLAVGNIVSAAQSSGGTDPSAQPPFAVVTAEANGTQRLWVGPAGALRPVELPETALGKPVWRRGRDEVWLAAGGKQVYSVVLGADGVPQVQRVGVDEVIRHGSISELALSRDGIRVAAVVNGQLVLASIVGSGPQVAVRNTRTLPMTDPAPVVDADFLGTDQLVVVTSSPDTPLVETSLDGLTKRQFGTTNLTPPISGVAAVSERPVLVADQVGVWSASTPSGVWQQVGDYGPNSLPVYPG